MPRGWAGLARIAVLVVAVLALGGLVAPMITKTLNRRGGRSPRGERP